MANTYTQCYFHLVFAVKNRDALIKKEWKGELGKLSKFKFDWQKGYGAFSHSRSQIDTVAKYILTQEEHHKTKPFKEEYLNILEKNNVEFKDEYLFEFFCDIKDWD